MDQRQDPEHLRTVQYATSANLNARIELHRRFSTNARSLHDWLFEQMALERGSRVLEVGAGTGILWAANADRLGGLDLDLVLTDLSEGMLRDARAALRDVTATSRFSICDVQRLPFPTGSFDVVIANFMLYHAPDLAAAVRELRRVLRPSGVLVAATFGAAHLAELDALVMRYAERHAMSDDAAASFGLETGAVALRAEFERVEVRRFDDALVVTEAEPIVAYIDSMLGAHNLDSTTRDRLHAAASALAAAPGGWRITKDPGVLLAH